MAKANVKALCLRFDLADEDDRRAYGYLQDRDKTEFGSYTKLVSRAVNEFFERRSRLADDPYFETREKEDAFIERVLEAVRCASPSVPVSQPPVAEEQAENDENVDAIFDFLDGFV